MTTLDTGLTSTDEVELSPVERAALIRRATLRLVPFLFFLYMIAYLDRVNVSIAKLQMQPALHFSDAVYGLGTGIFFIGYFFFEVPSNLMLARFGAKRWIARIMFTWGLLAMAMALTRSAPTFYFLRFLLGLGEAGFFPGVILYLTCWFTRAERGRIVALFMTANMTALIIGNPISGKLLEVRGLGLAGWQWLFLLEGLPAVIVAFVVLWYLPNGPEDAPWLAAHERRWFSNRLKQDDKASGSHNLTLFQALSQPRVLLMSLLYFTLVLSMYGYGFWLPSIIKSFGKLSDLQVSCLTDIPYIATAIGMVLIGMHSDRKKERRLHVACCAFVGSIALAVAALSVTSPVICLSALTVAAVCMWGTLGPFWSLATEFLAGAAAAGAIALTNSIGNLGGFVGPYTIGKLDPSKFGFTTPLLVLAGSALTASIIAACSGRRQMPTAENIPEAVLQK